MAPTIAVADLPLWLPLGFSATWPEALGDLPAVDMRAVASRAPAAAHKSEEMRSQVRDLLRAGGYRPSGRGKPASEYLAKAASEGGLPVINPAVDILNVVSLICGVPISVVDLELTQGSFAVRNGAEDEEYVFNQSGQTIKLKGLLSLCDSKGPCANAVKDSQRTKTSATTTRTFQIMWAPKDGASIAVPAHAWYMDEVRALGARVLPWPE